MMRIAAVAVLLSFAAALAAQSTPASPRQPSSAPSSGFSISGVVVSATTGTPLDRAEVTLSTTGESESQIAVTVTTENGAFRFDRLQAGNYALEASRRGYITTGYQEHDGFFTGVVTGPGLDAGDLRFELFPTAAIGGTITDDSGEPVAGAHVHLFRQDQHLGDQRIIGMQTEFTDDTGAYEFSRIRAGTFYLSVSASPWFAVHPNPKIDPSGNLLPADQQPPSPLDVAYPTTFYENATDSDSATPIAVRAGDHVEADFSLHAVPAIHIQVRLQAPGDSRALPMPQLMQQVFGADDYTSANQVAVGTPSGGVVADYSGIAPGHYLMRAPGQPGEERTASVDLTLNQTLDMASTGANAVDVSGKIAMASGEKLPTRTRIWLVPADSGQARENAPVADDGSFTLHAVRAGRYDVEAGSQSAAISIQQMMATGAEVQGNRITVAAQPVLLAATLARGATAVSGYARQNGKAAGGVMILLVPRNGVLHDLYRRDQSNTDGSFLLSRVVAGDYILVAIENGWTLEWSRPEVMAPYLARGLRVRVTGERTLKLATAVPVQAR